MAIGTDGGVGNVQKRLDILVALAHLTKDEIGLLTQGQRMVGLHQGHEPGAVCKGEEVDEVLFLLHREVNQLTVLLNDVIHFLAPT